MKGRLELLSAVRSLGRSFGFTLVAGLTLAVGIGSVSAILSVANQVLFRTAHFDKDLFLIGGQTPLIPFNPTRPDIAARAYEQRTNAFAEYAKASIANGNVVIEGHPVASSWLRISPNLLPMLGVSPTLGRGFQKKDAEAGSDDVVVVSDTFWRRHLKGDSSAIGQKIIVGNSVCTVIGVLKEKQSFPAYFGAQIFRPFAFNPDPNQSFGYPVFLLGKLRVGVTAEQASGILQETVVDYPAFVRTAYASDRPKLSALADLAGASRKKVYWVLLGAVGFLYSIACVNAASLVVARILGRSKEFGVRLALGGGRASLVRQVLTESLLLGLVGAAGGVMIANWLFPVLVHVSANSAPQAEIHQWTLDWQLIGLSLLTTIPTMALVSAAPLWYIFRAEVGSLLRERGTAVGESPGANRLRALIVIVQIAFAMILVVGAALMITTIRNLRQVDLGFDASNCVRIVVGFTEDFPRNPDARLARLREMQAMLVRLPGTESVGFGTNFLLAGAYYPSFTFEREDGVELQAAQAAFDQTFATAAGLRLKAGRWFADSSRSEILVNSTFAQARWPGKDPIGQSLKAKFGQGFSEWLVVGVVEDVRGSVREKTGNYVFRSEVASPGAINVCIARLKGGFFDKFTATVQSALYEFDPRIVVQQIAKIDDLRDDQLWAEQTANSALKVLAAIALALTTSGIFSALTYSVNKRQHEFGVRLALGATYIDVLNIVVVRSCLIPTSIGIMVGTGGVIVLQRSMGALLYETSSFSVSALAGVISLLLTTSLLASIIPTLRAMNVDVRALLQVE